MTEHFTNTLQTLQDDGADAAALRAEVARLKQREKDLENALLAVSDHAADVDEGDAELSALPRWLANHVDRVVFTEERREEFDRGAAGRQEHQS